MTHRATKPNFIDGRLYTHAGCEDCAAALRRLAALKKLTLEGATEGERAAALAGYHRTLKTLREANLK